MDTKIQKVLMHPCIHILVQPDILRYIMNLSTVVYFKFFLLLVNDTQTARRGDQKDADEINDLKNSSLK